jgi:hypothetical protein
MITINQFRAKVYEILSRDGWIERKGVMFYPEGAVLDCLEMFFDEFSNIPDEEFDVKLKAAVERGIQSLSQGRRSPGN